MFFYQVRNVITQELENEKKSQISTSQTTKSYTSTKKYKGLRQYNSTIINQIFQMININNNQLVPQIPITYTREQPIINNYIDTRSTYTPGTASLIASTKVYFVKPNFNEAISNNNNAMNSINRQHSNSNINPYNNNLIENQSNKHKNLDNYKYFENEFNPIKFESNLDLNSYNNNPKLFENSKTAHKSGTVFVDRRRFRCGSTSIVSLCF